jgi:hypothetical protein
MCELEVQIAISGVGLLYDVGFLAGLWDSLPPRDVHSDLPQQHHDLLWLLPLDWQERYSSQVNALFSSGRGIQVRPTK